MIPAVHRRGHGPTLVCHPGGPGFSSRFFGGLAGLDDALELVLVDPRGTGDTPRPADGAYAIADYVADLEELRAELGLERMNLLGYSHGGVVAMAYAARHPRRVERLILLATTPRFHAEQEEAMRAAMEERSGEPWYPDAVAALEAEQAGGEFTDVELTEICDRELPLYFARFGERERAFLDAVHEQVNADALNRWNTEEFTSFDLRPELGRIEAPTLVVAGARDFICTPASARETAAAIRDARVAVIDAIRAGKPVLLPTDTVYGLCTSPYRAEPVERLYRLKGREATQPTAILAADLDFLLECVPELRGRAATILRALLPGPYTVVVPNPARRYRWLTGTRPDAIGVRVPELPPEARAVLEAVGAVVATSANLAGGPDPRRLDDVPAELRSRVAAELDGGELPGTPSTVVDLTGAEPAVLREGAVPAEEALACAREALG